MIAQLIAVEWLKLRRSLALLTTFACPLMVVVLIAAMTAKRIPADAFSAKTWAGMWMGMTALWCYFMLPLYVALITSLINGAEHRHHGWRVMLTLPISRMQLFAAKAAVALLLVVIANVMLYAWAWAACGVFSAFGYATGGVAEAFDAAILAKVPLACLPIVALQHALSWRVSSAVLPLVVGVIATMGIVQVGSSAYWVYYPWSYTLMAINGSDLQARSDATIAGALLGMALFAAGCAWLSRRETNT